MSLSDFTLPIILIALGIGIVVFLGLNKKGSSDSTSDSDATAAEEGEEGGLTDEQKQKLMEKRQKERLATLENVVVPGNLPEVVFYFGSQTGTAEKFACALDEEANYLGIEKSRVVDFNNFDPEEFPKHKLCIVIVATHYEGDPCDNTKNFYKWFKGVVKDKSNPKPFEGMNFCIFGLGDTSYELFNEMGIIFDRDFEKLGGKRIYDMGVANAEHYTTEDDFEKWRTDLWTKIFAHYEASESPLQRQHSLKKLQSQKSIRNSDKNELPWLVQDTDFEFDETKKPEEKVADETFDMNMRNYNSAIDLPIKSIKQLRQQTDQGSTFEVIYDLSESGMTYVTASNFALYPINRDEDVEKFAKLHKLNLKREFKFQQNPNYNGRKPNTPFKMDPSKGITVREALTRFIDLRGAVTKKFLKELIPCCRALEDREKIEEITKLGSKKYDEVLIKNNVGLMDLHEVLPSMTLKLEFILQKCTTIMPRYYTIASSGLAHPKDLAIAISLTKIEMPDGSIRDGLTSGYYDDIFKQMADKPDQKFTSRAFVKNSNFEMPTSPETPIMMVGPGTGLVPFVGFMQERNKLKEDCADVVLGPASLFFGCRNKESDFIYRDLMADMHDKGIISDLNLAFSRPSEADAKKQYVQDVLAEKKEQLIDFIRQKNGYFFICGATKMGADVQALLKETLGEEDFAKLQKEKRLRVELWSS